MNEFEVTRDHLKLLSRTYWRWSDSAYDGAVAQDIKRPYGNSYVIGDLWEILHDGQIWDEDERGDMPEFIYDNLLQIHREMLTVVQILTISVGAGFTFGSGLYRKSDTYDSLSWRPVPVEPGVA